MKHRYSLFALMLFVVLFGSQCTSPPDQSIIVSAARAPGNICDFSNATLYVESAAVDLAAYGSASSYFQVFGWENDLENISVTVTQQITSETPNTFIATTIENKYQYSGATKPPDGLVNISASIAPGGTPTNNSVGVYFLTQEAMASICGAPTAAENCPGLPAGSPSATLLVTFQITGALVGGGAASTNPITYPVYLFNSGNTVPNNIGIPGGLSDGGVLFKPDPTLEPWTCLPGTTPQVTSCGVPGRDITYCATPP
jgi:hypothetical protein